MLRKIVTWAGLILLPIVLASTAELVTGRPVAFRVILVIVGLLELGIMEWCAYRNLRRILTQRDEEIERQDRAYYELWENILAE